MLNTEKVLRLINEINVKTDENGITLNHAAYLELKAYVTEALHFAVANRKGGKPEETRRRAALAYLKRGARFGVPRYRGTSWIENGHQILTDSYTAYRFAPGHHIDGLPQASPEEIHVPNTQSFFDRAANTTGETIINRKDLETAIAIWKAEKKPKAILSYPVGNSFYNAQFLLEALKLLGVEEAALKQREPDREKDIHYSGHFVLEGREAVLMPIIPPKKGESRDAE